MNYAYSVARNTIRIHKYDREVVESDSIVTATYIEDSVNLIVLEKDLPKGILIRLLYDRDGFLHNPDLPYVYEDTNGDYTLINSKTYCGFYFTTDGETRYLPTRDLMGGYVSIVASLAKSYATLYDDIYVRWLEQGCQFEQKAHSHAINLFYSNLLTED